MPSALRLSKLFCFTMNVSESPPRAATPTTSTSPSRIKLPLLETAQYISEVGEAWAVKEIERACAAKKYAVTQGQYKLATWFSEMLFTGSLSADTQAEVVNALSPSKVAASSSNSSGAAGDHSAAVGDAAANGVRANHPPVSDEQVNGAADGMDEDVSESNGVDQPHPVHTVEELVAAAEADAHDEAEVIDEEEEDAVEETVSSGDDSDSVDELHAAELDAIMDAPATRKPQQVADSAPQSEVEAVDSPVDSSAPPTPLVAAADSPKVHENDDRGHAISSDDRSTTLSSDNEGTSTSVKISAFSKLSNSLRPPVPSKKRTSTSDQPRSDHVPKRIKVIPVPEERPKTVPSDVDSVASTPKLVPAHAAATEVASAIAASPILAAAASPLAIATASPKLAPVIASPKPKPVPPPANKATTPKATPAATATAITTKSKATPATAPKAAPLTHTDNGITNGSTSRSRRSMPSKTIETIEELDDMQSIKMLELYIANVPYDDIAAAVQVDVELIRQQLLVMGMAISGIRRTVGDGRRILEDLRLKVGMNRYGAGQQPSPRVRKPKVQPVEAAAQSEDESEAEAEADAEQKQDEELEQVEKKPVEAEAEQKQKDKPAAEEDEPLDDDELTPSDHEKDVLDLMPSETDDDSPPLAKSDAQFNFTATANQSRTPPIHKPVLNDFERMAHILAAVGRT